MITRVTAHFDATTNKHRVDVVFSEAVARQLASNGKHHYPIDCEGGAVSASENEIGNEDENALGEFVGKKSGGSTMISAADHAYSVTVE